MSIEERILQLTLDDEGFQDTADNIMSKLDTLKKALTFSDVSASADVATSAFSGIGNTVSTLANTCVTASNTITDTFTNAWNLIYAGFMSNIGTKLSSAIIDIAEACTIEPISTGWSKYEESVESVQKIMINTGYEIEKVEDKLNVLATYSDQTSYGYTDMTSALSTFVSAGQDLDKSVTAIMGLSNWCATAGVNAQQASGAYDMFSKAVQAGYMGYDQWRSLQRTYNLGTTKFYEILKNCAIEAGKMKENTNGTFSVFNEAKSEWDDEEYESVAAAMQNTLKYRWATTDLLYDVLDEYGTTTESIMQSITDGDVTTVSEAIEKLGVDTESFGYKAMLSAQQAKTWSDTVNAWKDVVSTQYRGIFEDIFGNYEEAAEFWTDICDTVGSFFWDLPSALHEVTSEWHDLDLQLNGSAMFGEGAVSNYKAWSKALVNMAYAARAVKWALEESFQNVMQLDGVGFLSNITTNISEFAYQLKNWVFADEEMETLTDHVTKLQSVVEGLLTPFKTFIDLVGDIGEAFGLATVETETWTDEWGNVHEQFKWLTVLKPVIDDFVTYATLLSDKFKELDEAFKETDPESGVSAYQNIVDIFKDFFGVLKDISSVLGGGIMHFLGLDYDPNVGNALTYGISSASDSLKDLFGNVSKMKKPSEAISGVLDKFSDKLGLTKTLHNTNGELNLLSENLDATGYSFETARQVIDDESWELLQTVFGGDNFEETWGNITDAWSYAISNSNWDDDITDNLFNGKTFAETLDEVIAESDVSTFDLLMTRLKNMFSNMPSFSELISDFWGGFSESINNYGFNIPTNWEEAIQWLQTLVDTVKGFLDEHLGPLLDAFNSSGDEGKASGLSSIFESIGSVVGTIVGIVSSWNFDRYSDIPTILEAAAELFDIVVTVIGRFVSIFSDPNANISDTAVTLADTVSKGISKIIKGIAGMIDSIAVSLHMGSNGNMEKAQNDLGTYGDMMVSIGTIIGNILPAVLDIATNLVAIADGILKSGANASGTTGFQTALQFINQAIQWVGNLVIDILNFATSLLNGGVTSDKIGEASGILDSVMGLLSSVFNPIVSFISDGKTKFGGLSGFELSGQFDAGTALDYVFNLATVVADYAFRFAGVITTQATDVIILLIQNLGRIIVEILRQAKTILTVFSSLGGAGAIANLAALLTALNLGSLGVTITGLLNLVDKYLMMQGKSQIFLNYATAIQNIGMAILAVVVAIIALGFMATHFPAELVTGLVAFVALAGALALGVYFFYKGFSKVQLALESSRDLGEEGDAVTHLIQQLMNKLDMFGLAALLTSLGIALGVLIGGVVALTAVTSLCPGGIGAMFASLLVVAAIIAGLVYGSITLVKILRRQALVLQNEDLGRFAATVALFSVIALVMGIIAAGLTVVFSGLVAMYFIIDKISGGAGAKYVWSAIGTLAVIAVLIAALMFGIVKFINKIDSILDNPTWEMVASLGIIVAMLAIVGLAITGLTYAVAGILAALAVSDNLSWSTVGKALVFLGIMVALIIGTIKWLTTSSGGLKSAKSKADSLKLPSWETFGKLAVILLMLVFLYKTLISGITQIAAVSTGNIDVGILWNCVAVVAVMCMLCIGIAKLIADWDDQIKDTKAYGATFVGVITMMVALMAFLVMLVWVTSKLAGKQIDIGLIWQLVGVIGVLAVITGLLAAVAYFVGNKKSVISLAVMLGGMALCLLALVACVAILGDIGKGYDSTGLEAIWDILQVFVVIAAIAAVVGALVAGFIPGVGALAVAIGALLAVSLGASALLFAAAIYVIVAALENLQDIESGAIVSRMTEVADGLDQIFDSFSGWIGAIFSVAGAFALLKYFGGDIVKWLAIFVIAIIVIIGIIVAALAGAGDDIDTTLNNIGVIIEKVAEMIPGWFDSIIDATEQCLLNLVTAVGTFSPELLEAFVFAFANAFAGVEDLMDIYAGYRSMKALETYGSNDAIQMVAYRTVSEEIGFEDGADRSKMSLAQRAAFDKQYIQEYEDLWDEYNQLEEEGYKLLGYDYSDKYMTAVADIKKIANESYIDAAGYKIVGIADYIAQWMESTGEVWGAMDEYGLYNRRSIDEILDASQLSYFAEAYPEYWQMILDETDYNLRQKQNQNKPDKDTEYWSKYYGAQEDAMIEGAEGLTETAEGIGKYINLDAIKSELGFDKIDPSSWLSGFDLSTITSKFDLSNFDATSIFGDWTSLFGSTDSNGEAIPITQNFMLQLGLVDEDGNVISSDATSAFEQLLGSSTMLTGSEGESITTVQGLVDVVLGGGTMNFNGTEIDLASTDASSLFAGLIASSVTGTEEGESVPVTVPTQVTIEGNTVFNTEDVMGDAEILNTDGVATYKATGQALGAALLSGFYSNYSGFSTKASSMAWKAIATLRGFNSTAHSAGEYFADGFINGLSSTLKQTAAYQKAYQLGQSAVKGLNAGIDAGSPSKLAYQSGLWFGEGAVNGITAMTSACYNAAKTMGDEMTTGFGQGLVSPVLDTSSFQNGVGIINDTFAEASALNADYTVRVNGRNKSTKDMLAEAFVGLNSSINGISGKMGFGEKLDQLGDKIGQMGFYVDGKQFARAMAEHNDTALARTYVKRGRS